MSIDASSLPHPSFEWTHTISVGGPISTGSDLSRRAAMDLSPDLGEQKQGILHFHLNVVFILK